jgi:hypothetical protein
MQKLTYLKLLAIFLILYSHGPGLYAQKKEKPRTIYFSYTLHGNMNYDRYPASTIWSEFPKAYQNILDFIEAHPEFKGQMQLSGQTYKTMQLVKPEFLEQTRRLYNAGIIDVTGTFYSEPVNICLDGETNLFNARLGTKIISTEMFPPSGFFLQESAYNPQLPYIMTEAGVDWIPVRLDENKYNHPVRVSGLDGTKITAVQEVLKHGKEAYLSLIQNAPDNSLFLVGGDYEIPERFIDSYYELLEIDKEDPGITIVWTRVSDYLRKFPPKEEVFINNADLSGILNWDSYSRWTSDPYDIQVHTLTKQAMHALKAAKIALYASREFAAGNEITYTENPDKPVGQIQSAETDMGIDWDIEKASSYPSVEPNYLLHNGGVSMLSRAEHLLAFSVNSDSRGWWPLYERRHERMEALQQVIDICNELIFNALNPIGQAGIQEISAEAYYLVYNPGKARTAEITLEADLPGQIITAGGRISPTLALRKGNKYKLSAPVELPEYGYTIVGITGDSKPQVPSWVKSNTISNQHLSVTANDSTVIIKAAGSTIEIGLDSFQLKILAEMVFLDRFIDDWKPARQHGNTRISVCSNLTRPVLRVERQIDYAIHLRQDYELFEDHVGCTWDFFMAHPTLIRKFGSIDNPTLLDVPGLVAGNKREILFRPEGLMARIKTNEPGRIFYEIPYGITDHKYPDPSYVTMLNFSILQQSNKGIMLAAKTGSQAVAVDQQDGSLGLVLGASNGSGPVRNPKMEVSDLKVYHERPFYAETFKGSYHHEFSLFPFIGDWKNQAMYEKAAASVFEPFAFRIKEAAGETKATTSPSTSLLSINNPQVELTMIEEDLKGYTLRLNERTGNVAAGILKFGENKIPYKMQGFGILSLKIAR